MKTKKISIVMSVLCIAAASITGCSVDSQSTVAPVTEKAETQPAEKQTETALAEEANSGKPKYIFLFIGDGMSYPQIESTNYYLGALENKTSMGNKEDGTALSKSGDALGFLDFPVAGSAQTYDSTSFCPDSASTATSISTGHKTYSGTINMNETATEAYETIAEKLHSQKGYKVGIVTSVNLNHATPAAFYCHQESRSNYWDAFGGKRRKLRTFYPAACPRTRNFPWGMKS